MLINVYSSQKKFPVNEAFIKDVVRVLFRLYNVHSDEVSFHFVGKARICSLHDQFFSDPSITDCITFPLDPPSEKGGVLGEVFICPEVAYTYAKKAAIPYEKELILYVIHGFLHLIGYDDIEDRDEKQMRLEEARSMASIEKEFGPFLDKKIANTSNKI